MRFYTGNMFPTEYRNAIFVARHGSWNRSKKFGGDIALVSLNQDGTVKSVDPFITASSKITTISDVQLTCWSLRTARC
jgi:glucose/arabinose dehydrogenase